MLRKLTCVFLLLLAMLLVPAARSEAAPILFEFTVTFTDGLLDGDSFQGTFSVDGDDCPGGVCDGTFTPDSFFGGTLLSFNIDINGAVFDITDDLDFPEFPEVAFAAGLVTLIDFLTPFAMPGLSLEFGPGENLAQFISPAGNASNGAVGSIQQVPEPTLMLTLGIGLAGVGARRWRQQGIR